MGHHSEVDKSPTPAPAIAMGARSSSDGLDLTQQRPRAISDTSTTSTDSSSATPSRTSLAATRGTLTPLLSPGPTSTAATSPQASASPNGVQSGCLYKSTTSSASHNSSVASGTESGGSSTRPPTLSDIAARMKLGSAESPDSSSSSLHGSHLDVAAPLKGRLGLAGRLNSSSSDLGVSLNDADKDASKSLPAASGVPPTVSRYGVQSQRDNTSTAAGGKSSPNTSIVGKVLPSLNDIRERMNKKGQSASPDTPSSPSVEAPANGISTAAPHSTAGLSVAPPSLAIFAVAPAGEVETQSAHVTAGGSSDKKAGWSLPPNPSSSSSMLPPASTKPLAGPSQGAWRARAVASAPAKALAPGHHPLQHQWTLYFDSKSPAAAAAIMAATGAPGTSGTSVQDPQSAAWDNLPVSILPARGAAPTETWEATLKTVGEYHTVEAFMGVFGTIKRPSTLERNSNYHLFKDGIKPMWEDTANAKGGKWILTFDRKQSNPALVDRSWVWLVLALIGEELDTDDEVTGAVVSTRPKFDRIALWVRRKDDVTQANKIARKLLDLLQVGEEAGVALEFSSNLTGSHHRGNAPGLLAFSNGAVGPSSEQSSGISAGPHVGPPNGRAQSPVRASSRFTGGRTGGIDSGGFGAGCVGRTTGDTISGGGLFRRTQAGDVGGRR